LTCGSGTSSFTHSAQLQFYESNLSNLIKKTQRHLSSNMAVKLYKVIESQAQVCIGEEETDVPE